MGEFLQICAVFCGGRFGASELNTSRGVVPFSEGYSSQIAISPYQDNIVIGEYGIK